VLDAWLVDAADEAAARALGADGWTVRAVPALMTDVAATAQIAADALALVDRLP
jgi:LPPG:FO 2-phospho-L-lactate transferase